MLNMGSSTLKKGGGRKGPVDKKRVKLALQKKERRRSGKGLSYGKLSARRMVRPYGVADVGKRGELKSPHGFAKHLRACAVPAEDAKREKESKTARSKPESNRPR